MNNIKSFFSKNWKFILLIVLTITFFSSILILSYDSAHYLKYVEIFERKQHFYTWDVVRGPVFPLIIYSAINLFGRNSTGILIMFYLFYLIFTFSIGKMLDRLIPEFKFKTIMKVILLCIVVLNPIILGYYHVMLTENVAITVMTLSCLISFIWLEKDSKLSKWLISIYFVIMTTFAYFLKQPYAYVTVAPMLIASIYSIIKNHTFKNVRYHLINFASVVLVLGLSIVCWNKILVYKGVEMKSDRTSDGMLKTQIMSGSGNIRLSVIDNYDDIKDDSYLDENEKKIIQERDNNEKDTVLITIKKGTDVVDKDIVEVEKIKDISVAKSVGILGNTFIKHSGLVTESYLRNYCALSSICVIKYGEDGLYVSGDYSWSKLYENADIGYKTFTEWGTFYYVYEEGELRAQDFKQPSHPGFMTNIIGKTMNISGYIYKYLIIVFPLLFVIAVVLGIVFRKKMDLYQSKIYKYSLFLWGCSFICLLANVFVGLFIDRYAVFSYPIIMLGLFGFVLLIISSLIKLKNKKNKVININKDNEKKIIKESKESKESKEKSTKETKTKKNSKTKNKKDK